MKNELKPLFGPDPYQNHSHRQVDPQNLIGGKTIGQVVPNGEYVLGSLVFEDEKFYIRYFKDEKDFASVISEEIHSLDDIKRILAKQKLKN